MKKLLIILIIVILGYFVHDYIADIVAVVIFIFFSIVLPGIGLYYKMMMYGGGYSYRSPNFKGSYQQKKSSYDENKEKAEKQYQRKNYEYEGSLKLEYDELGIDYNISDEGLKKNHKKLARMYHPDMHSDKSDKEIKIMEEKFKRINEAYENIKKYRGI